MLTLQSDWIQNFQGYAEDVSYKLELLFVTKGVDTLIHGPGRNAEARDANNRTRQPAARALRWCRMQTASCDFVGISCWSCWSQATYEHDTPIESQDIATQIRTLPDACMLHHDGGSTLSQSAQTAGTRMLGRSAHATAREKGIDGVERNIMDVRLDVLQPVKRRRRFSRKDLRPNRLCDRRLLLLVGLLGRLGDLSGFSAIG